MIYDTNNVFAKILRGEIPCQKIYEDEKTLAFKDLYPKAPVHILIIPKDPYCSFVDFTRNASSSDIALFFKTVEKITHQLNLSDKGFRLITNIGKEGGQEVPHFHVHVLGG